MNTAASLPNLGLSNALIIDDAYALPDPKDVDDDARGGFLKALRDQEEVRAPLLRARFAGLDTDVDMAVTGLLSDPQTLTTLWELSRNDAHYAWCKSAFEDYESAVAGKRAYTDHIEKFLTGAGVNFQTRGSVSSHDTFSSDVGMLFLDFFLVDNEHPDEALKRAVSIAERFATQKTIAGKPVRPLLFLISNRPETRGYVESFRNASKLKGSFFRFLDKDDLKPSGTFVATLRQVVERYPTAMVLADYLDVFRTTAEKAVEQIADRFDELELTDLSLLHYLRIEAEQDRLGRYTTWLFSESISNWLQSHPDVRTAGAKLDTLIYQGLDGRSADPRNVLFNVYSNVAFRYDVRDVHGQKREDPLWFGDVFVRSVVEDAPTLTPSGQSSAADASAPVQEQPKVIDEYLIVVTAACDLIRPPAGLDSLCILGRAESEADVPVKDLLTHRLFTEQRYPIQLEEAGKTLYRIIKWDPKKVRSIPLKQLEDRTVYRRVGQMQSLFAYQLQEEMLRSVGRIGLPPMPSVVGSYQASVVLTLGDLKDEFNTESNGCYAGIAAFRRVGESTKYVVNLTNAFLDLLKSKAEQLKPKAGQNASKLDSIIDACGDRSIQEIEIKNYLATAGGGAIKIFFRAKTESEQQGKAAICEVIMQNMTPVST